MKIDAQGLNEGTTRGQRLHITILGRRNSGKSTLINTLTGQDTALVSPVAGTTTDPVRHAIELDKLGPCVLIDTAGFDDKDFLGRERVRRTDKELGHTDIAILVIDPSIPETPDRFLDEVEWKKRLDDQNTPTVLLINSGLTARKQAKKTRQRGNVQGESDHALLSGGSSQALASGASIHTPAPAPGHHPMPGSLESLRQRGFSAVIEGDTASPEIKWTLIQVLDRLKPERDLQKQLLDGWVKAGDRVVLVMPQDKSAPQGRLILPQSQTIRELMSRQAIAVCCPPEQLAATLASLSSPPELIITDSQVLKEVRPLCPSQTVLTTFSILFAALKGDILYFAESAAAIAKLGPESRILIAEACSHAPKEEDIGRVKIPALLRKRIGEGLAVDVFAGADFPSDISRYDLIIQCGSCMRNRAFVLNRVRRAQAEGVPMTNYGVAIAWLTGILDEVSVEPPKAT